jgi:plasmid rolling circle replication initiator protein Rep
MIPKKTEILKEKSFNKHKKRTIPLYDKYYPFNPKKANKILDCGSALWFNLKEHIETKERALKLESMFTCKDRFCPFCNWRRQLKYSKMIYNHIQALEDDKKHRYIFLTLTVKNCKLDELRATVNAMGKAFSNMTKTVRFKNSILGFLRVLEFTVQKSNSNMMHPHYHVLLVVSSSYFVSTRGKYINTKEWSKMWAKSLKVDYAPIVDVRIVKPNGAKNANASVVAEMSKYPLKDTDISRIKDFELLAIQLKGVRNINAGGILKGILKRVTVIDDDLVNTDDTERVELWRLIERICYQFENIDGKLNYYRKEAHS